MKRVCEKEVGELIRRLRDEKGITQMELAEMVGVSYQQIQKYEKGKSSISLCRLKQIADALDVPIVALLQKGEYASESPAVYRSLSEDEERLLKLWENLKNKKLKKLILELIEEISD